MKLKSDCFHSFGVYMHGGRSGRHGIISVAEEALSGLEIDK
jgi:hypothetical protein